MLVPSSRCTFSVDVEVGEIKVEPEALKSLAKTMYSEAHDALAASRVTPSVSGCALVDGALEDLARAWSTQAEALARASMTMSMNLEIAAVDYTETDSQVGTSYGVGQHG